MAKKKPAEPVEVASVTAERAMRLHRLVRLLADAGQTRANLLRRLGLNIRGFYRDLEALRQSGITINLVEGRYALEQEPAAALDMLPLPDPGLTLGEARLLVKGRSKAHQKIRQHLARVEK